MEYQSLILGILFSIGIFAIKSGAGMAYLFSGRKGLKGNIIGFLLFSLTYAIIFTATLFLIKKIDPVTHLVKIQAFIKSGMLIHIIMALLMMIWGILLLRHKNETGHHNSRGWLLLAVPCPVCITVIIISTTFLITLNPDRPYIMTLLIYLSFIMINFLTLLTISIYRKYQEVKPEYFLGTIMLLIAAYFIISVTVMPNFSDIDKVYRLAMYKGKEQTHELIYLVPFSVITALAFFSGFADKLNKIKRSI
ncbi:MAG: DUF2162 domain-containing protein [Deltaproteobacteria bacterium]|nr:DUF2162 domain-containing protein [Deltaproteobacteria bacterium]